MKKSTNSMTDYSVKLRRATATKAKQAQRELGVIKNITIELTIDEYNKFIEARTREKLRNKDILFIGLNNLK